MDEDRAQEPLPEKISQYPEEVRRFLHTLDASDITRLEWLLRLDDRKIARFEQWDETLSWLFKTSKFGKALFYIGLALLGAVVTFRTVWDLFFPRGNP
jgi:hypothetical protein